jgi:hypothetical protein
MNGETKDKTETVKRKTLLGGKGACTHKKYYFILHVILVSFFPCTHLSLSPTNHHSPTPTTLPAPTKYVQPHSPHPTTL